MPRLGRRTPKNHPALMLSEILSGTTPTHPSSADYLNIGGWKMLGNDQYGDCVAVTWANVRRLMTRQAGDEIYPTFAEVIDFYRTQNPNFPHDDNGMDIQTALEYLVKNGGPDGVKALAFAKVNYRNLDEVKAALSIFGFLWTGINVQAANQDQFGNSQPWDYVQGSDIEGGHSIISGGFDSDQVGVDVRMVTWAEETGFTDNFWSHLTEETWVVIWPEHLSSKPFQEGIDQQKLADAYTALTGRPFPVQPTPTPPPTPTPDVDLADALAASGQWFLNVKRHSAKKMAQFREDLQAWINSR